VTPASTAAAKSREKATPTLDRMVEQYGDLLFDLAQSVLWSPGNAQIALRKIFKRIRKTSPSNDFQRYERAWVLQTACRELQVFAERYGRKLTPSEQMMLDASTDPEARLRRFDSYFHRLHYDQQILLLLRDKYRLPYSEIAMALQIPESSLKLRRQQALRTLEEWLWNQT
jgi:DNA-directed RNA polymerase specialized sigma24 family protein